MIRAHKKSVMRYRAGTAAALAVALSVLAAVPAPATMLEKGSFANEAYGFAYECGFPVEVTGTASGSFHLRQGKGDDASAFFSFDRLSFVEVHTNADTGAWFTVRGHFVNLDVTATRLEGSLFEFRSIKAGQPVVVEDSSGNLVLRDRGALRVTIRFDTGGDDQPGGTLVDVVGIRLSGPHAAFQAGRCAVATDLIGS